MKGFGMNAIIRKGLLKLFICAVVLHHSEANTERDIHHNKLLLLILPGLGSNEIKDPALQGIQLFQTEGIKAEYVKADFPSTPYVNFHSIVTGHHPDSHGFFNDNLAGHRSTHDGQRPEKGKGDPIWATATRQGRRCYLMYWPECGTRSSEDSPESCEPLDRSRPQTISDLANAVERAHSLLNTNRADFVGIYSDLLVQAASMSEGGPNSEEMMKTMKSVDGLFQQMHFIFTTSENFQHEHPPRDTNVLVISSHGMLSTENASVIDLSEIVNVSMVMNMEPSEGYHVVVYVSPNSGYESAVYHALSKEPLLEVSRVKHKFLEDLQITRKGTLLVVAKPPNLINMSQTELPPPTAISGYDVATDPGLRGSFLAFGPHFKTNYSAPAVAVTDLYQVMCKVLDVDASPNSGEWTMTAKQLMSSGIQTSVVNSSKQNSQTPTSGDQTTNGYYEGGLIDSKYADDEDPLVYVGDPVDDVEDPVDDVEDPVDDDEDPVDYVEDPVADDEDPVHGTARNTDITPISCCGYEWTYKCCCVDDNGLHTFEWFRDERRRGYISQGFDIFQDYLHSIRLMSTTGDSTQSDPPATSLEPFDDIPDEL